MEPQLQSSLENKVQSDKEYCKFDRLSFHTVRRHKEWSNLSLRNILCAFQSCHYENFCNILCTFFFFFGPFMLNNGDLLNDKCEKTGPKAQFNMRCVRCKEFETRRN
uniref:Uncharacterized protein n=1 Tax=Cucumis sativus TaxID=3659 RepID=A0A0A0KRC9_CUCSA